jgi:hypothetical protein
MTLEAVLEVEPQARAQVLSSLLNPEQLQGPSVLNTPACPAGSWCVRVVFRRCATGRAH